MNARRCPGFRQPGLRIGVWDEIVHTPTLCMPSQCSLPKKLRDAKGLFSFLRTIEMLEDRRKLIMNVPPLVNRPRLVKIDEGLFVTAQMVIGSSQIGARRQGIRLSREKGFQKRNGLPVPVLSYANVGQLVQTPGKSADSPSVLHSDILPIFQTGLVPNRRSPVRVLDPGFVAAYVPPLHNLLWPLETFAAADSSRPRTTCFAMIGAQRRPAGGMRLANDLPVCELRYRFVSLRP